MVAFALDDLAGFLDGFALVAWLRLFDALSDWLVAGLHFCGFLHRLYAPQLPVLGDAGGVCLRHR